MCQRDIHVFYVFPAVVINVPLLTAVSILCHFGLLLSLFFSQIIYLFHAHRFHSYPQNIETTYFMLVILQGCITCFASVVTIVADKIFERRRIIRMF